MRFIPGFCYDGGKTAVLDKDEFDIAREMGFSIDEKDPNCHYIQGNAERLGKLSKAIRERKEKAIREATSAKKKAALDDDSRYTIEALAKYALQSVSPEMVYEYAVVYDNRVHISKPQFVALNTDLLQYSGQRDIYTTFASFFEILQMLGASGFRLVANNGAHAVLMKQMAKDSKEASSSK